MLAHACARTREERRNVRACTRPGISLATGCGSKRNMRRKTIWSSSLTSSARRARTSSETRVAAPASGPWPAAVWMATDRSDDSVCSQWSNVWPGPSSTRPARARSRDASSDACVQPAGERCADSVADACMLRDPATSDSGKPGLDVEFAVDAGAPSSSSSSPSATPSSPGLVRAAAVSARPWSRSHISSGTGTGRGHGRLSMCMCGGGPGPGTFPARADRSVPVKSLAGAGVGAGAGTGAGPAVGLAGSPAGAWSWGLRWARGRD